MVEQFKRVWKRDFNFRITVVFFVLYIIDLSLDGELSVWIAVPYFTSMVYGMVKMFLKYRLHKKFIKEQEELRGRFEAAIEERDAEEATRMLILLEENLIEYGKKMGFKPYKREEGG